MIKTKSPGAVAYVTVKTGIKFDVVFRNPTENYWAIPSTEENIKHYNRYKAEIAKGEHANLPGNIGLQKIWESRYIKETKEIKAEMFK